MEEAKHIDKTAVFPVVFYNLLCVAGNWTGFQEKWLVNKINRKTQRSTLFGRAFNRLPYFCFKGMNKDYWKRLEKTYLAQKTHETDYPQGRAFAEF